MPEDVDPIIGLDTYEPEETNVLTIYVENLYITDPTPEGFHHVWVTTSLGRRFRVTMDGHPTFEAARSHAQQIAEGMRAHLEERAKRKPTMDILGNRLD